MATIPCTVLGVLCTGQPDSTNSNSGADTPRSCIGITMRLIAGYAPINVQRKVTNRLVPSSHGPSESTNWVSYISRSTPHRTTESAATSSVGYIFERPPVHIVANLYRSGQSSNGYAKLSQLMSDRPRRGHFDFAVGDRDLFQCVVSGLWQPAGEEHPVRSPLAMIRRPHLRGDPWRTSVATSILSPLRRHLSMAPLDLFAGLRHGIRKRLANPCVDVLLVCVQPPIVPTPNSYSRRISSKSSTLALQSNRHPPIRSTVTPRNRLCRLCPHREGQITCRKWLVCRF